MLPDWRPEEVKIKEESKLEEEEFKDLKILYSAQRRSIARGAFHADMTLNERLDVAHHLREFDKVQRGSQRIPTHLRPTLGMSSHSIKP